MPLFRTSTVLMITNGRTPLTLDRITNQERALRFVYEDYEWTDDILLKKGNHDMLYIGRLRNMATEIFKALHGSTPIYRRDLFEERDKIYNLRSIVSLK